MKGQEVSLALLAARVFWLAGPVIVAGILHMAVVKKDLFKRLRRPIDGGRRYRGEFLFGPNKTWRGFFVMTLLAGLLGLLQGALFGGFALSSGLAYMDFRPAGSVPAGYLVLNLFLGAAYILAELPNSFVKRRLRIPAGKAAKGGLGKLFVVIDQADSVVLPLLAAGLLFPLGWTLVIAGIAALTLLHLLLNGTLYLAGVRKSF